jgi:hypothetical protein
MGQVEFSIVVVSTKNLGDHERHRGDSFTVDGHGNLFIQDRGNIVCMYAAGEWQRCFNEGNLRGELPAS